MQNVKAVMTQTVETSRFPHFLDIRITDGDEVVSLTSW
jgi:hypothetical protein